MVDGDVDLAVATDLGIDLEEVAAIVEGDDIGVDAKGDDGGGGVGELVGNEEVGSVILEEKEEEGVSDDTLENNDLDHEQAGEGAVHGDEEGDSHDEGVGRVAREKMVMARSREPLKERQA